MRERGAGAGPRGLGPALAVGLSWCLLAAPAASASPSEAIAWLQRAAQAARQVSYEGTFVHTNGERTSTVRVTHVNANGEEHERIEPLDGTIHEIVRRNDEIFCRFPDAKTVRLDPRLTQRFFPGIIGAGVDSIAASYDVSFGKTERVLGHECRWIKLEARDKLRFSQAVCSENHTGLILRARTFNESRQAIENYSFTDLRLGIAAGRSDVKSIFRARNRQWANEGKARDEVVSGETGWDVTRVPSGFHKVTEVKRHLPGRTQPVSQIVYTDGLARLSVFVEPNRGHTQAASVDGTTTFYQVPFGDHVVSVFGEVPLATAEMVARAVAARRP